MCGTISISIILGALALVPSITSRYAPAQKFAKLEDAIKALEEILERAKAASNYTWNHMEMIDAGCRLLQAKLSASTIQSQLLEMHSATWKTYFKSIRAILQIINQCVKEVKEIQTAMLLIIEEERQRKLTEESKRRKRLSARLFVHKSVARTVTLSPTPTSFKSLQRVDQSQPSLEELSSIP
ncbi:hypothetical protein B0H13DRAFT_2669469 [Mycena leptocephala]|nr:hypothetical protein B0H13DRAFT_2669469 [Mycena leptocephala]